MKKASAKREGNLSDNRATTPAGEPAENDPLQP